MADEGSQAGAEALQVRRRCRRPSPPLPALPPCSPSADERASHLTLQDATQKITEATEALERRQQLRDANLNPARPGAHSCQLERLP